MSIQHTDGPWQLTTDGDLLSARGKKVATVHFNNGLPTYESQGNAILIQQAPELLALAMELRGLGAGQDFADLQLTAQRILQKVGL